MAADVEIRRWIQGSRNNPATKVTISSTDGGVLNTRANACDYHDAHETTYPVQIPAYGQQNYSFWVSTRLYCNKAGPASQLSNFRWYAATNSTFGQGVTCVGIDATGYYPATGSGTLGVTGLPLTPENYGGNLLTTGVQYNSQQGGVFNYTSGSPRQLGTGLTYTAAQFAQTNPVDKDSTIGNLFVYQIVVDSNAQPGTTQTPVSFYFKYDET